MPSVVAIGQSPFRAKRKPVGVPRRFSIGTMMILVTAFALLLGVLKSLGAPPPVFAIVSIFVVGIAASQSLLFKGKRPRLASIVGGMIIICLFNLFDLAVRLIFHSQFFGPAAAVSFLVKTLMLSVVIGGVLGYLVGWFVASIFLVRKEPDDAEPMPRDDPQS